MRMPVTQFVWKLFSHFFLYALRSGFDSTTLVVGESRKELTIFGRKGGGLAWAGVSATKYWTYK